MLAFDLSQLVAIYGALAGTIALAIQFREHLRKRGVLRVVAHINQVRMTPTALWETNIVMEVTNVGEVPVLVRHVRIEVGDYFCEQRIDEVMQPGHFFRSGHSLDDQGFEPAKRRRLWVEDGRGRRWHIGSWWLLWRRRHISTISEEMPADGDSEPPPPDSWIDTEGLRRGSSLGQLSEESE